MKILNLVPSQLAHLQQRHNEVALQLLNIDFESPDTDQQMIRHHVYLKGKLAMLAELIEDEYDQPEVQQPGE